MTFSIEHERDLTRIAVGYPLPIADAVSALLATDEPHERRDRVVECFRAAVRFLGAVTLSVRVQFGSGPAGEGKQVEQQIASLRQRSLTDGQWVSLCRELTRAWADEPGDYPVAGLVEIFHGPERRAIGKRIDGLLQMRRTETVAHGATGDADQLAELLARRVPELIGFLQALDPLWADNRLLIPLARPGEDQAGERQRAWVLMRDTPPRGRWSRTSLAAGTEVEPGRPCLADATGRPRVSLYPIALFRRPSPDALEELFVLDGEKRRGARYVAIPSMAEHVEVEVWGHLVEALFDDLRAHSDADAAVAGIERPFRGLESFDGAHAALFFGRDSEAEALANRIRRHPLVTVTGASGCGKTSLLEAGVLPLLDDMVAARMRPGRIPTIWLMRALVEALAPWPEAEALAARLRTEPAAVDEHWPEALVEVVNARRRRLSGDLLLLVDQAEELLTLCTDAARRERFAIALAALAEQASVRVVISLREDFFARLSTLSALRGLYNREVEVVVTPDRHDLIRILVEPARLFGYQFEDEQLVQSMLTPIAGEPAALAMLQFCADRMWERRDRAWKRLTWDGYRAVGGVEGALASHADATLDRMTPSGQAMARSMLTRLVNPDSTRAVIARDDLLATTVVRDDAEAVLDTLIDARLLLVREGDERGGATVEMVHEALLQKWGRLRDWLASDSELLRIRARISLAAERWRDDGKRADLLLGAGKPLDEALMLERAEPPMASADERAFIAASVARARRRRRLRKAAIAGLAVLTVMAVVFGGFAWQAQERAESARRVAEVEKQRAQVALARANEQTITLLEEQGRSELMAGQPERAAVFLAELYQRGEATPAVRFMLSQALQPLDNVVAILQGHQGESWSGAFSPDGSLVATASYDQTARIWSAETGAELTVLRGHTGPISTVAFSADGKRVLTASDDQSARIWDVQSGAVVMSLAGHEQAVIAAHYSPVGPNSGPERIVTISNDYSARLWSPEDGALLHELTGHRGPLSRARFSADGRLLVTASEDGTARVWQTATGAPVATLSGHKNTINYLALSADGRRLATVSDDQSARVWSTETWSELAVLPHQRLVWWASFADDRDTLVTAGASRDLFVWRVADQSMRRLQAHEDLVVDGTLLSDRRFLVSAGRDRTSRLWHIDSGVLLATIRHSERVWSVTCARDDSRCLTTSADGQGLVSVPRGGQLVAVLQHANEDVASVGLSGDGRYAVTGGSRGTTVLWDARTGRRLHELTGHSGAIRRAVFTDDGAHLVTASQDGSARVWSVETGGLERTLLGHAGGLLGVRVSRDGRQMVTWAEDRSVRSWDPETGRLRFQIASDKPVGTVKFSPDGAMLAATTTDGRASVIDAENGSMVRRLGGGEQPAIKWLSFSRDNLRFVARGDSPTAHIWKLDEDRPVMSLTGHSGDLTSAVFGAGGRYILTASEDASARLWDARTGAFLRRFEGHGGWISMATLSRDSARVFTASVDGTVRIWDTETGRPLSVVSNGASIRRLAIDRHSSRVIAGGRANYVWLWDTSLERRPAADVGRLLESRSSWRLVGGRLQPRSRAR